MPIRCLLEICLESVEYAVAAERGGADRIELCSDLISGGVTPSVQLMGGVRRGVHIPIHVLIRPRAGDFVYSQAEFETMKCDIQTAKDLGMDGIVLGLLDENMQVDGERTGRLIRLARPLPVTFHRAFDLCRNLTASLQAVIETGATRILTSGGKENATKGLASLADLVANAGSRIAIMPGGGVRANNVGHILRKTRAKEIHTSLGLPAKTANEGSDDEFEAKVREIRRLIDTPTAQK
ncbi:MAG TPA: copper homeostasis protein CutC [Candidatus Aquilonibacter sp.]|jgi:copper homeostasis protein|nr:copper homeostasis protein CutC [Candidatus Aquilonibacter sp.]